MQSPTAEKHLVEKLIPKTIFAMPVGPPFGGMTTYTAMLRGSVVFQNGTAVLFDTMPSESTRFYRRLAHAIRNTMALVATIRRERADVVYFMTSDFLGFYEKSLTALCCRMFGVKTILHPVGSFIDFYGAAGLGQPGIRFLLRRQNALIVVQHRVQTFMKRLAPTVPVWLIPNPVDSSQLPRPAAERDPDVVRILFAGSLVTTKGILDLIEVARVYRDQLKRAVITVIGEGELFAECQRRIREYGVEGLVEMRGFVDSATKTRLLATSDIFCLPSHTEGTPIAVLEAMGSELPIVATNVGGIPFVVQHGTQGWLCAPGDVAGLGRMLIHLVKNASVRAAMGRNGLRRVREQFDIQTVAKLFITRLNAFDAESRYREDEAPAAAGASNQI